MSFQEMFTQEFWDERYRGKQVWSGRWLAWPRVVSGPGGGPVTIKDAVLHARRRRP
jgi:hypothetical protein